MNSWEMTEVEKSDYERFVANHEANMRAAEFDPETVVMVNFRRREDKFWRIMGGLFLLSACAGFWYLFFTHV